MGAIKNRLKDMKDALMQKNRYDLNTQEGQENTDSALSGIFLGGTAALLGVIAGSLLSAPLEKKMDEQMKREAFQRGQINAYQTMMKNPAYLMDAGMRAAEKDPRFKTSKF